MSRYPDRDMAQIDVSLREETIRIIESMQESSRRDPDMWDMSRSECVRELVEYSLSEIDGIPEIEELIDPGALDAYRRQKRHEQRRREAERAELRGGWRGRVSTRLSRRLAGSEPYPPEEIEILAESYLGDVRDLCDDPEEIEDHREWLDRQIEEYRRAFDAKQIAPEETFSETHDEVRLGADLWRLRQDADRVVSDLVGAIESEHTDPDALVSRLGKEWGVEEPAVWTLIDMLSPDDLDSRALLSGGSDRPVGESINPDRSELIDPDLDPELISTDPEPIPEPTDPEPTEEIPTEETSEIPGVSDGGIVVSEAVESYRELQESEEIPEELVETAADLLRDDSTPAHAVPHFVDCPEEVAVEATNRAREKYDLYQEVDQ